MGKIRQRILRVAAVVALAAPLAVPALARKFFPDDPIAADPAPIPVEKPVSRKINEYYDFFLNTFFEPDRELKKSRSPRPSAAINTLGEVPDSGWFTNRIGSREMTVDEMVRGPGNGSPPAAGPWTVLSAKNEGVTPGLVIEDSQKRRYLLKFDPKSNPEMASAADVIGSRFFHALGYNVPENYIVRFDNKRLTVGPQARFTDTRGKERAMHSTDIERILRKVPSDSEGQYRGMASLFIKGQLLGPFKFFETRRDDPNDVVPHQDRRDLRGLFVFAAWLNHTDSKSINSLDALVNEDGQKFIKHYLIDFGAILGSDSFTAKSPRAGHVHLYDFKAAAWQFLSLGLYVNRWMLADYPDLPAVGRLDWDTFEPEKWKSNYPNPAFDSRTPGDTFWAAKRVMAFSDEAIRAMVATAEYTDPKATEYVTRAIIERRNRVGRAFLDDVLPLDAFRVSEGSLQFDDLAVRYGLAQPRKFTIAWSTFDNERETRTAIPGASGAQVPKAQAEYLTAEIRGAEPGKTVAVYLRGSKVVGIDRTW
jgi:hypothetical protein